MTVTVAGTWNGGYAPPSAFQFPRSATGPAQVSVATTAGDWLVAAVAWQQPYPGAGTSVTVSDDAHNWWEPVGAPVADVTAGGIMCCSLWAAPAARAARYVQACPTGPYSSLAIAIADLAGIGPGWQVAAFGSASGASGTSLTVSPGGTAAQSVALAVLGAGEWGSTITPPASPWSVAASSTIEAIGNVPASSTVELAAQVFTGAVPPATWTVSAACPLAGLTACVVLAAPPPAQLSPHWPAVITEAAIGAGPQDPPSQLTWTGLSARSLALAVSQGKQYTLGQLEAAQGTVTLDNPDGALIPPGTGTFAGLDSGTPLRRRIYWPGTSPWYVPFSGYFRRWPYSVPDDALRGQTVAEVSDIWAYASGTLDSIAREELKVDGPYALWPLDGAPGATGGANIAQGNSAPLALTLAKAGAGNGATVTWGANSGALLGDSSAAVTGAGQSGGAQGVFQLALSGTALNTNGYGAALVCQDPGFPPVASGVTVEGWFLCNSNTNTTGNGFAAVSGTSQFTVTGSNFANGTPVTLTSTGSGFPVGVSGGVIYYVINASGASFQVSATPGGSAVVITTSGSGFLATTTPWAPRVLSMRNATGLVAEILIRDTDGALQLGTRATTGATSVVVVDGSRDWRLMGSLVHLSLSLTSTTWRVTLDGGQVAVHSGSMAAIHPGWSELCLAGIMDRSTQGYCMPGQLGLWAVYPYVLAQARVVAHYWGAIQGMAGDAAQERIDRLLGYAGIAGRRWIGQAGDPLEKDLVPSGQDVGGQSAATSVGNIATSTVPAQQYVAPSGDIVYLQKSYAWNQPVRWVLGDDVAAGEIPFSLAQFSTDYDPTRVYDDIQLSQLDTQMVTVPAGVMSATTVAALIAASQRQYGDQPYQQTAYLQADYSAAYGAGSGLADLATWIAIIYGRPRNRVPAVVVDAAAYPAAWPLWGAASAGDMVQVILRLATAATSPLVSVVARVTQTQRSMRWSVDSPPSATITLALDAAPEYMALTCDDSVRGLLNGTNVLAWLRASRPRGQCRERRARGQPATWRNRRCAGSPWPVPGRAVPCRGGKGSRRAPAART
jgi:hypothetical protein